MADDADISRSPKQMLDAHGLRPRKRFGQNFLVDPRFAQRVAQAIPERSFVIEIGAGTGSLTEALCARARELVALEVDRDLVTVLRERFAGAANVAVHDGDALAFDFRGALGGARPPRAICGNLPYYITTPLIERMVECADDWETAVVMVQREYARRLAAKPGTADYGSLSVFVGYYCAVEKLFDVGAAGFYPAPSIASTVVRLVPRENRAADVADEALLLRAIRAAFAQRRKTLENCLFSRATTTATRDAIASVIHAAGLEPKIRGERLSLDDFKRLTNALSAAGVELA
jgi:16S rRNA (adenine1518-N6/adenine1519-N6)-dimethyltransferase